MALRDISCRCDSNTSSCRVVIEQYIEAFTQPNLVVRIDLLVLPNIVKLTRSSRALVFRQVKISSQVDLSARMVGKLGYMSHHQNLPWIPHHSQERLSYHHLGRRHNDKNRKTMKKKFFESRIECIYSIIWMLERITRCYLETESDFYIVLLCYIPRETWNAVEPYCGEKWAVSQLMASIDCKIVNNQ